MSAKNPVGDNDKATAVVADDWEETLKCVGGSQSDDWNHVLGNQAIQSLWIKQSDNEVRARHSEVIVREPDCPRLRLKQSRVGA
jgi:hypothetical protein